MTDQTNTSSTGEAVMQEIGGALAGFEEWLNGAVKKLSTGSKAGLISEVRISFLNSLLDIAQEIAAVQSGNPYQAFR